MNRRMRVGCVTVFGIILSIICLCLLLAAFATYGPYGVYSSTFLDQASEFPEIIAALVFHILSTATELAIMLIWAFLLCSPAKAAKKNFNIANLSVNVLATAFILTAAILMNVITDKLNFQFDTVGTNNWYPYYKSGIPWPTDNSSQPRLIPKINVSMYDRFEDLEFIKSYNLTTDQKSRFLDAIAEQKEEVRDAKLDFQDIADDTEDFYNVMHAGMSLPYFYLTMNGYFITSVYMNLLWLAFVLGFASLWFALIGCCCNVVSPRSSPDEYRISLEDGSAASGAVQVAATHQTRPEEVNPDVVVVDDGYPSQASQKAKSKEGIEGSDDIRNSATTSTPKNPPEQPQQNDNKEVREQEMEPQVPKSEEHKAEEPKSEETKDEEPKAQEPKAEEPKTEEPKAEEPKAQELKVEEPKNDSPKDSYKGVTKRLLGLSNENLAEQDNA